MLKTALLFLLLGIVLFSGNISPRPRERFPAEKPAQPQARVMTERAVPVL